ncbi:hypothetical protein B1A74_00705 [Thioalkalivibrio halophilus]|uniref:Uncharacterized protein n=1 Tax=Thioalkalivibrio halophilus TaxID=252474 RepID=A0A1V3A294_9GAMM|nr:hypothetical protein B1A74_00705 [Thioalkalivibrio halophilus]
MMFSHWMSRTKCALYPAWWRVAAIAVAGGLLGTPATADPADIFMAVEGYEAVDEKQIEDRSSGPQPGMMSKPFAR